MTPTDIETFIASLPKHGRVTAAVHKARKAVMTERLKAELKPRKGFLRRMIEAASGAIGG